ncbi:MAG TPA: ATP-binding cassette domain-containing protein [Candidatus Angelobacter sp.]|jgi:NitT/TauT family transport system ATP-binding protein|nr:ATP-binding cassette domain-containing protein [Candidatus Angelobacter sp.]
MIAALDKISLDIQGAAVTAILGPSGCGKTTLLNILAGLDSADAGSILMDGKSVDYSTLRFGYVFQTPSLIPWRNVLQNAVLGIEVRGKPRKIRELEAEKWLHKYGLADFVKHYPNSLSIGMQQRVSIIRAVVFGADILLLDEPFRGLDYGIKGEIEKDISSLVEQEALTAVLVTHDIEEAVMLADRIYVLSERPGKIIASYEVATPRQARRDPGSLSKEVSSLVQRIWADLRIKYGSAAV